MNSMLSLINISKTYRKNNVKAVSDISFECAKGEIISLVGSSGSGKSTLLRLIAGLEIPDSGQILLNDRLLNKKTNFVQPENRDIDIVFQDFSLFPNMTVNENIYFGKNAHKNKSMIEDLINFTHINEILNHYPHEISGGQEQRVALVRALGNNPSLLLLDEPLSHLDNDLKETIREELITIFKKLDVTVLIVTHDIEDSLYMSDKTIILNQGTLEQFDQSKNIYKNPNSEYAALLFGKTNIIPRRYIPQSKYFFKETTSGQEVVSIRPHQFTINPDKISNDTLQIKCEIKDIIDIGFRYNIKMVYKDLVLTAEVESNNSLKVGDVLTFYILFD